MLIRELKQLAINAQNSAKSWVFITGFGSECAIYGICVLGYSLNKYAKLTHGRNDKFEKITYISVTCASINTKFKLRCLDRLCKR